MYQKHFGLNSRPFCSTAEGDDVYAGAEQSAIVARLHKGLSVQDAVVTVSGPVGVGKTTVATRALHTLPNGRMAAWLGRMHLSPEEVLELLLAGFGIAAKDAGKIRRFAAFRRVLQKQSATGIPVAIIVEDARRIGVEALAELEAVTAADTGDDSGANIVLMGEPGLNELLSEPALARLRQRVRHRSTIAPLSATEAEAYLEHCISRSGGNYRQIFEPGVADIVFDCSEGIPRVINTVCEAALVAAMEEGASSITRTLMTEVAADACGFVATNIASPTVEKDARQQDLSDEESSLLATRNNSTAASAMTPLKGPPIGHDVVVESGSYTSAESKEQTDNASENALQDTQANLISDERPAFEQEASAPDEPAEHVENKSNIDTADIPNLIDDTQPELRTLPDLNDDAQVENASRNDVTDEQVAGGDSDIEAAIEEAQDAPVDVRSDSTEEQANSLDPKVTAGTVAAISDTAISNIQDSVADDAITDEFDGHISEAIPAISNGTGFNIDVVQSVPDATTHDSFPEDHPGSLADEVAPSGTEAASSPMDKSSDANGDSATESTVEPMLDLPTLSDSMRVETLTDDSQVIAETDATDDTATTGIFDHLELMQEVSTADDAHTEIPPATAESPASNPKSLPDDVSSSTVDRSQSNIEALEAALQAAKEGNTGVQALLMGDSAKTDDVNAEPETEENQNSVPEITLDSSIAEQQPTSSAADKVAEEIGSVNSLEDMSDRMAETLFGCGELDQIAAEVSASSPTDIAAATEAAFTDSPVQLNEAELAVAANDAPEKKPSGDVVSILSKSADELTLEKTGVDLQQLDNPAARSQEAAVPELELTTDTLSKNNAAKSETETSIPEPSSLARTDPSANGPVATMPNDIPLNESVAMRIDILNKMKNNVAKMATENVELGEAAVPAPQLSNEPQPEPIENQINTSITQTRKKLNLEMMAKAEAKAEIEAMNEMAEEDKKDKKSGGLFSRFRKSS